MVFSRALGKGCSKAVIGVWRRNPEKLLISECFKKLFENIDLVLTETFDCLDRLKLINGKSKNKIEFLQIDCNLPRARATTMLLQFFSNLVRS